MTTSHMEAVGARKAIIEGWEMYAWERVGPDATLLKGGIPRIITRGKRKGKRAWDTCKEVIVVVTDAEVAAEEIRYVTETGNCSRCYGKCEVFASWDHIEGTKYRKCKACDGTGKAPA